MLTYYLAGAFAGLVFAEEQVDQYKPEEIPDHFFVQKVVGVYNEQYDKIHARAIEILKIACMNNARIGRHEAEVHIYDLLYSGYDHDQIVRRFADTAKTMGFETVTLLEISHVWRTAGIRVTWLPNTTHSDGKLAETTNNETPLLEPSHNECAESCEEEKVTHPEKRENNEMPTLVREERRVEENINDL